MSAETTKRLYELFRDPQSNFFLDSNSRRLYDLAKTDASLYPVTYKEIDEFKRTVESISRGFDQRTLRGRKRHLQYRAWKTYSPKHILLGE